MAKNFPVWFPEGLVVGDIRNGGAVAGDPVGDSGSRMVQILGFHQGIADPEKPFFQFDEMDAASQISEGDRKIGILHLPGDRVCDRMLKSQRSVDVQLRIG